MSHEIDLLDAPKIPRKSADLREYTPKIGKPELSRGSKVLIGVTYAELGGEQFFVPVEINLGNKKGPKCIIIVGDEPSGKENVAIGTLRYVLGSTNPKYLKLNIIADKNDPNRLTRDVWQEPVKSRVSTAFPEGPVATKIIDAICKKLDTPEPIFKFEEPDPHIFIMENLGHILAKTLRAKQYEKVLKIGEILSYKGYLPILTLVTVKSADLPFLTNSRITPETTNGVWLFGKSESDKRFMDINPGVFYAWNSKKESLLPFPIVPFDY